MRRVRLDYHPRTGGELTMTRPQHAANSTMAKNGLERGRSTALSEPPGELINNSASLQRGVTQEESPSGKG